MGIVTQLLLTTSLLPFFSSERIGFHSVSLFYCILPLLVPLLQQPIGDIRDGVLTNPFSPHPAARGMSEIKIS